MKKQMILLLLLFVGYIGVAQTTVSGNVYMDDGEPAIGATVKVADTDRGVITGLDGAFEIQASQGDELEISYVGYETQTVIVNGSTITVTLQSSNFIDEVVVTAFGIEQQQKQIGYALQEVDADEINTAGQVNALEGLQGRVSGVQINRSSGTEGGGVDILIRGVTSVNPGRSNQPLIVVDGIALNNDTFTGNVLPSEGSNSPGSGEQFAFSNRAGDLNPEDIESYSVLKGAAATALYGIRASNGAIIITTKKGQSGKPKVSVSTSTTFRNVEKTPSLQTTYREGHRTSKKPTIQDPNNPGEFIRTAGFTFYTWGVPYTDDEFVLDDGTVLDLSNDKFYSPYDLFRTGNNFQSNFNLSGANDKIDYFISAGLNENRGIVPNTDYGKTNFRAKGGYQIADNLKISSSVTYTKSGGSRGTGGDKSIMSTISYWATSFDVNDYLKPDGTQKNASSFSDNPRYLAEVSNLEDDVNRWVGNATLNWSPKEFLNVNYSIQMDNYSDNRNRFVTPDLDVGSKVGGFLTEENIVFNGIESNLLATITNKISDDWGSSFTAGHQVSDLETNYNLLRGEGLNIANLNALNNASNLFGDKNVVQTRNVGVFGDLKFDYRDQLFLSFTGRNDWISTMPSDNRSFFYPSANMAYVFGDLIDPEANVFSFAKLRTSWAQVGKGPNFGQVGSYYISDPAFPFLNNGGFRQSTRAGDPDIVPEKSNTFEIGTDLRFLDNKIRLDYSYYRTKVSDQIFPVGTAYSSSLSSYVRNAGDYETWGHEALVTANILTDGDFTWSSNLNFSNNQGEITAIPEDLEEIYFYGDGYVTSKAKVGDSIGDLYGWVYQTTPSGERYVAPNGYWVVTGSENEGLWYNGLNEQVKVGNAMPDFILSTGNEFSYKNFDLNFLIEWKNGGQTYDTGYRNAIRNGNLALTEVRDEMVVLDGYMDDGSGGFVPNTTEALISANSYYRSSTRFNGASDLIVRDSDWLKLRSITLGYNAPQSFSSKIGAEQVGINMSANNIILWTPWDGFDPEGSLFSAGSNIYGFTGLNIPLTQSYSFGLNLKF